MHSNNRRTFSSAMALPLLLCLLPTAAQARFMMSGVSQELVNGDHMIRIPDNVTFGGIEHELVPSEWHRFRVRVTHSDAQFPNIGWRSDEFAPTSNNIQVCDITGCETPSINAGTENLDWTDKSKITVYLEAKECLLCGWESFTLAWE